jgi:pimeloyl-ACP methyl ester carboxylesterase
MNTAGSSRTWKHVTDKLAPNFHTIAIDHRGWGASDAPADGYDLKELAADAEGVIQELNLKRYVLVGHSMGGKVAQLMASRRPTGLAGLVLVAPSPNVVTQFSNSLIFPAMTGVSVTFRHGRFQPISCDLVVGAR